MTDENYATVRVRMRPGPTTQVSMAANADLLESLGALLAEHADVGGVETRDATTLEGPERPEVVIYTVPDAVSRVDALARGLASELGLDALVDHRVHAGDTWRDRWKDFYEPRVLGAGSLLLRPSWIERRPDDPEREIVIDPGRAFGTGIHETTRLCLDGLVAAFERGERFARVLDLGCGSGILALVAARLFAEATVLAVDLDPEATATTRENVELNALGDRVETHTGRVEALPRESFDLVVANIRTEVLVPSAPEIVARASSMLLLSGILREEADEIVAGYAREPVRAVDRREEGDWICFRYTRSEA